MRPFTDTVERADETLMLLRFGDKKSNKTHSSLHCILFVLQYFSGGFILFFLQLFTVQGRYRFKAEKRSEEERKKRRRWWKRECGCKIGRQWRKSDTRGERRLMNIMGGGGGGIMLDNNHSLQQPDLPLMRHCQGERNAHYTL